MCFFSNALTSERVYLTWLQLLIAHIQSLSSLNFIVILKTSILLKRVSSKHAENSCHEATNLVAECCLLYVNIYEYHLTAYMDCQIPVNRLTANTCCVIVR